MIKVHEFDMVDGCTPRWSQRQILQEAFVAAKRQSDMIWILARAVSIVRMKEVVDDHAYGRGPCNRWTIAVWGHEIVVPDEFKHWTERLQDMSDRLTTCEGWDEVS